MLTISGIHHRHFLAGSFNKYFIKVLFFLYKCLKQKNSSYKTANFEIILKFIINAYQWLNGISALL